jgi:hypothetical protein
LEKKLILPITIEHAQSQRENGKATSKKDSQRNLPKKAKKHIVIYHTTQRQGKAEKMKTSGLISKY